MTEEYWIRNTRRPNVRRELTTHLRRDFRQLFQKLDFKTCSISFYLSSEIRVSFVSHPLNLLLTYLLSIVTRPPPPLYPL